MPSSTQLAIISPASTAARRDTNASAAQYVSRTAAVDPISDGMR